jgi:hypothetical protein
VSTLKIISDIHLYAIWDKDSTLSVNDDGTVSIKDKYKDLITTLYVPRFVGNRYITAIGANFCGDKLKTIVLPQSSLLLDDYSFSEYDGVLVLPKYDYLSGKPNIQISTNAIGDKVYTYIHEGVKTLYLPYSVNSIAPMGVACLSIHCEINGKPDGWDNDWRQSNAIVEWSKQWQGNQ